jgi:hypothetical protein
VNQPGLKRLPLNANDLNKALASIRRAQTLSRTATCVTIRLDTAPRCLNRRAMEKLSGLARYGAAFTCRLEDQYRERRGRRHRPSRASVTCHQTQRRRRAVRHRRLFQGRRAGAGGGPRFAILAIGGGHRVHKWAAVRLGRKGIDFPRDVNGVGICHVDHAQNVGGLLLHRGK